MRGQDTLEDNEEARVAWHRHRSLGTHVILGKEMESDTELIVHQPIEESHNVLMKNERMVTLKTCFCCLCRVSG